MKLSSSWGVALLAAAAMACGDVEKQPPTLVSLALEPAEVTLTVVNDLAVAQDYKVWATSSDGKVEDVTEYATLSLRDEQYGAFTGAKLSVTGRGAGPTRVIAKLETVTGEGDLTVYVKKQVIDPDVPPTSPGDFDSATEDATLAPTIRYPADKILVPPNIGQFDVHWTTSTSTLFEMRMTNDYVDIRRYTKGIQNPDNPQPYWAAFAVAEWSPIASTKQQLKLRVSGMTPQVPGKKGTAAQQVVDVTNENTRGGIYYWATTSPATIMRYDVEKPTVAPSRLFPAGQEPGGAGTCIGCHVLSKDGSKMAMTLDGGNGRGTAFNVANRTATIAVNPDLRWNFATFSPDGNKLLTVYQGIMSIRDTSGGTVRATLTNTAGKYATHPEISPDGSKLVNVECVGGYEAQASTCSVVIRPLNLTDHTAGAIQTLVAYADGAEAYYPSFSPDGVWIAYTRSGGGTYNIGSAETWLVKADGSGTPIKLSAADKDQTGRTNSWARWVPFGQTFGPSNEPMFYLTFSSVRPYGVRLPSGGTPQIWMTPVFPGRAQAGQDPSGPAFRVPFQDVATGNHIAQWTQAIVAIE
ncbi:MAG: PD40 domain-containing protein [Myxococcales bacterium]|nr:PD40 domain-containing protein [Myxococcales bacterium]